MFLSFEGFQPQNILILFLFSIKHSWCSWRKFLLMLIILSTWKYLGTRIFQNYCQEVKSYTPRWNSQLHHKRWLWWCSGHSLVNKFFKKQIIVTLIFCFWFPQSQHILDLFLFFLTKFSLVVLIKFILISKSVGRNLNESILKIVTTRE